MTLPDDNSRLLGGAYAYAFGGEATAWLDPSTCDQARAEDWTGVEALMSAGVGFSLLIVPFHIIIIKKKKKKKFIFFFLKILCFLLKF